LHKGFFFDGIKTGITDSAGPCLASSYKRTYSDNISIHLISVVLNCTDLRARWRDTRKICKWAAKKYLLP